MLTRKIYFAIYSAMLDAQWVMGDAARGDLLHTPDYYARKQAALEEAFLLFSKLAITYTDEDRADIRREAEELQREREARKAA